MMVLLLLFVAGTIYNIKNKSANYNFSVVRTRVSAAQKGFIYDPEIMDLNPGWVELWVHSPFAQVGLKPKL